jgi:hypothetical protein
MQVAKMRSLEPEPFSTPSIATDGDNVVLSQARDASLSIAKPLVAELWANANEGARVLAHGGLEIGGLLVGSKVEDGNIVVDDVIPLASEYQYGPSFQMSETDLARLASAIENAQEEPAKAIVGFFRSRTRGEGTLRESDFEILKAIERAHTSFATDFHYCLVLAPVSDQTALACVAMRKGAVWQEMPALTLQADPLSVTSEPPLGDEVAPQPPNRGILRMGAWPYAAAAVFILGVAGGAYRWLAMTRVPPPAQTVSAANSIHLGFSAQREGADWKLSWDRASIDALNPAWATLSIQDGGYQQQVPLSRAELASGLLYYTPQSSDLSFSLRVDRGGADLEEHVRVLEAPPVTQAKPAQAPKGAQAASKSRLARIMAAHAAAAAATEGDAPSTPAGAP